MERLFPGGWPGNPDHLYRHKTTLRWDDNTLPNNGMVIDDTLPNNAMVIGDTLPDNAMVIWRHFTWHSLDQPSERRRDFSLHNVGVTQGFLPLTAVNDGHGYVSIQTQIHIQTHYTSPRTGQTTHTSRQIHWSYTYKRMTEHPISIILFNYLFYKF